MAKKLYIGCALTHAPEEFRTMIWDLRERFRSHGFDILEFGWKNGGTLPGVNVYEHDMSKLDEADIFVAVCDYVSIGLGMELEHFSEQSRDPKNSRTIKVFLKRGTRLTKIVPDMLLLRGLPEITLYDDPEEIVENVVAHLSRSAT